MSNEFSYAGYSGSCEASVEDSCLHGRILFIDDLITYEGDTVSELKAAFNAAVNRYIEYCAQTGKPANKPYSGNFNIRVSPDIHKAAAQRAKRDGVSLNNLVGRALEKEINQVDTEKTTRRDVTINHVVTIQHQTVEVPYAIEESSWQQNQGKPYLRAVQ